MLSHKRPWIGRGEQRTLGLFLEKEKRYLRCYLSITECHWIHLLLFCCHNTRVEGGRIINYIDTKAKCRHLKKLTCTGTWRKVFIRVFIDWRYSQSCWYVRPSSLPSLRCVNKYTLYTYTVCWGGGGWSGVKVSHNLF